MKVIATVQQWCAVLVICSAALPAATIEATVRFERAAPPAVVLWIPGVTGWKPASPTVVDQRFEAFHPTIAVAPPGGIVEFHNSDSQQHNVFALDAERNIDTDLGLGLPGATLSLTVAWPSESVVKHGCKIHPQMQLWILALDSPFHAVSDIPSGSLETVVRIPNVPADTRNVTLWAPRCEKMTCEIPTTSRQVIRKGKPVGTLSVRLLP